MGPFSRTAPLRRAVRDLGVSSESKKDRDFDYAEMTRIMHLHNDYAKFMHFIMQSLGKICRLCSLKFVEVFDFISRF